MLGLFNMPYTKEQQKAYDEARSEKKRQYYLDHKEEFFARKKVWLKTPKGIAARKREKKAWYSKHKNEILGKQRVYAKANLPKRRARRAKNRDKINAQKRAWSHSNQDSVRATSRRCYLSDRENRNAMSKRYYEEHKERMLEVTAAWQKANPDKVRKSHAAWKKRNPEKELAHVNLRRARVAKVTFDESAKTFYLLVKQSPQVSCEYCGCTLAGKDCHVDHIVPISKGGPHIASNLCVSCPTCNHKKGSKMIIPAYRKSLQERMGN